MANAVHNFAAGAPSASTEDQARRYTDSKRRHSCSNSRSIATSTLMEIGPHRRPFLQCPGNRSRRNRSVRLTSQKRIRRLVSLLVPLELEVSAENEEGDTARNSDQSQPTSSSAQPTPNRYNFRPRRVGLSAQVNITTTIVIMLLSSLLKEGLCENVGVGGACREEYKKILLLLHKKDINYVLNRFALQLRSLTLRKIYVTLLKSSYPNVMCSGSSESTTPLKLSKPGVSISSVSRSHRLLHLPYSHL